MAVNLRTKDNARAFHREIWAIEPNQAVRSAKSLEAGAEAIAFDEAARIHGRHLLKRLREAAKENNTTWPRTTGIDCMGDLLMKLALYMGKTGTWGNVFGCGESADVSLMAESYQEATGTSDQEMVEILIEFVGEHTTAEEFSTWLWS